MRNLNRLIFAVVFGSVVSTAFAAENSVTFISPQDGATLDAMAENKVTYDVTVGPGGDHTHLFVDGKQVAVLRELKGSHTLEALSPGKHELCIKIVNKSHTPIGVDKCVHVTVK